jgi:hypothetical protein
LFTEIIYPKEAFEFRYGTGKESSSGTDNRSNDCKYYIRYKEAESVGYSPIYLLRQTDDDNERCQTLQNKSATGIIFGRFRGHMPEGSYGLFRMPWILVCQQMGKKWERIGLPL